MDFILTNENAIYYEVSYSCDNSIFLSISNENFFITDARYEIEAKENIKNANIIITNDLLKEAEKIIKKSKIKVLYFDSNSLNSSIYIRLNKIVKLKDKKDFSKKKRIIKTDFEIKLLKKASIKAKKGFLKLNDILEDNLTEKEIYFKLIRSITRDLKYDLSFNPIVAINENAAKPHALVSNKKLLKNDLLLIDAGIKYKRYCSDRTITICNNKIDIGNRKQKFKDKKIQKIYDIVYFAWDKAIKKAKRGVKASEIDKVAREVIEKAGYGKYFVHSTGHGVGLDIHEYPIISKRSDTIIEDNMVFTIEPGIYIPGFIGVRIEDMVVIKNRAEIL